MSDTPSPPPPALDASDFLPVSRQEILDAGQTRNFFRNAWWGRRDRIPDAADPLTNLIDRQMVSQGFITPERLVEMHTVGAEYDRKQPLYEHITQQAAKAGQAAVEADKAEHARIKAEKKAAAAEREKKRREGVAHRKATDIIFLGRGVSGLMGDRQSDAAKLEALTLPVLHSPADVAKALSLTIPHLKWLAFHSEVVKKTHYVRFAVKKRSGGERVLSAPHKKLKAIQRWILAEVLNKLPLESPAHGFVPARSIVTNATPHVGQQFVVNLDLKDFFPSIGYRRVRHAFRRAGYSGAVSTVFALLCTECPRQPVTFNGERYEVASGPLGLPQGAPTSPALSNLVARKLDKRLAGFAKKLGLNYTRYADDLTFSGPAELAPRIGYILAKVRHVAQEEGFTVNEKKTRVMRPSRAMEVTGVVVNDKPSVARDEVRRLRAILHRAKAEGLDKQNRQDLPHFRAWLQGKIAFVSMVNPPAGAKLQAALDGIS
jgi:retron-type reverse transcriptase